jgi:hypothetical protein
VTTAGEPAAVAPAAPRRGYRPLLREERQLAVLWGVLAASSLLLRPLWLAVAPLLPPCPFRALTGLPCLSCGTTRAAVAVLHGDVLGALATNPLATMAGVGFIAGGLIAPLWALAALPLPRIGAPAPRTLRIGLALALLAGWAWVMLANR